MFNKKNSLFYLSLIFLAGLILRLVYLPSFPPSLNWDEISHGYNAFSILHTLHDEWGNFLPLIFRAFGDYKLPVYIYSTVPSIALFGLTPFATRFPSALAGSLAIPGIFLLTRQLFSDHKNKTKLALLSAFILAVTPWHFFISRPALEANLALTLAIFATYFLVKSFERARFLIPASILFSLTLHTYNTYRIFTPLILLAFLLIYRQPLLKLLRSKRSRPHLIIATLIFLASLSLVAFQVFNGSGTARYEKLAILNPSAVFQIGQERSASNLSPFAARLLHNRPLYFLTHFAGNYLNYFSPAFLYQAQGAQSQFAIPGKNLLTLPVTLLFILGFSSLFYHFRKKNYQLLFAWLFLSPIAAALTLDPPQALRPSVMIPSLIIFASLGTTRLIIFLKIFPAAKKTALIIALVSILLAFTRYSVSYFTQYPADYSQSWQYGYQQAIDFINDNHTQYKNIFVTKAYGEPHIFYAFYTQLPPADLQSDQNTIRFNQSDWFWTDRIGNVYFVNAWDIPHNQVVNSLTLESGETISTTDSLLITTPDHIPSNTSLHQTIDFLDHTPAFIVVSF